MLFTKIKGTFYLDFTIFIWLSSWISKFTMKFYLDWFKFTKISGCDGNFFSGLKNKTNLEPAAVQPLEKRTKNQSLKAQNEVIMAFLWLQNWFSVAAASFTSWFGSWSWGREKRLQWPDYTFWLIFKLAGI